MPTQPDPRLLSLYAKPKVGRLLKWQIHAFQQIAWIIKKGDSIYRSDDDESRDKLYLAMI